MAPRYCACDLPHPPELIILAGILPRQRCLQVFIQLARRSNARQFVLPKRHIGKRDIGEAFDLLA
jgi:hypothetical protein